MANHFKLVCTGCGTVITQCRCPSNDKAVEHGECIACKQKRAEEEKSNEG